MYQTLAQFTIPPPEVARPTVAKTTAPETVDQERQQRQSGGSKQNPRAACACRGFHRD